MDTRDIPGRIVIDPKIRHGRPVIRGTRTPIARILGGLAGGMTEDEVLSEYELSREDLQAVYRYAASLIDHEVVHPLARPA